MRTNLDILAEAVEELVKTAQALHDRLAIVEAWISAEEQRRDVDYGDLLERNERRWMDEVERR